MQHLLNTTLRSGRKLTIESIQIDQTYRSVVEGGTSPDTRHLVLEGIIKKVGGPESVHLIEPKLTPLNGSLPPDHVRMPWYWVLLELSSSRPVFAQHGESCLSMLVLLDDPLDRTAIDAALADLDWDKHARDCDLFDF
jgi:hypothetical protein